MTQTTQIDLPVLIPGLGTAEDDCAGRLVALLGATPGIDRVHLTGETPACAEAPHDHDHDHDHGTEETHEHGAECDHGHEGHDHAGHDHAEPPAVCLHYDPAIVTLAQVERIARSAGAEIAARYGHDLFPIRAVIGEDAGRRIERALSDEPGVLSAAANLPAQVLRIEWDKTLTDRDRVQAKIVALGVQAPPRRTIGCDHDHDHAGHDHSHEGHDHAGHDHAGHDHGEDEGWYPRNKELAWSLIGGAILTGTWLAERYAGLPRPGAIGLYLVAYGFGGWDLASHWIRSVRRGKITFDIDLLMLLAAIGAAILGNWTEGAFLLFLFSLAHALEHYALGRARGAIAALAELTPDTARVRRGESETEIPIAEVRVGDLVIVLPGERVPVDGKVQSGTSAIDQAPITGESVPVAKAAGDPVYGGTVNGDGALVVVNESARGDRTLDRVIRLVEEAQTQKAPTERFVERFSAVFVPTVLVADLLMIVVPPLLGLLPWPVAFYRAMALLVAASPCALALGTPSAVLAGIAQAARRGVLVKGGAHLENLGNVRAMAFDKTGTLTVGRPSVTDLVPAAGIEAAELLTTAAAVERRSQHPLAAAVVRRAESDGLALSGEVGELQNVGGRGIRSSLNGQSVEIGSLRLWEDETIPTEISSAMERLSREGRSVMAVRAGGRWLGVLGIADEPREGVRATLDALRTLGVKPIVMLTGDNRGVAEAIAARVGVDEVRAELLPEDKVGAVQGLLDAHGRVAMTGDGVNDAPALATATVGIAMGGAGTAVALETADVALMGDDLARLPFAVGLARASSGVIRQNLAIAMGAIAILVVATVGGFMRIGPAVAIHEGSTLVVLANSLRLLGYGRKA